MTNSNHYPCPCGKSSDAFSIDKKGWGHCFNGTCNKNFSPERTEKHMATLEEGGNLSSLPNTQPPEDKRTTEFKPIGTVAKPLKDRGISAKTCSVYKVWIDDRGNSVFPLFDPETGEHGGNKTRIAGQKAFPQEGPIRSDNAGLFGRHAFPKGHSKAITITEGYEDAMAAYELMGSKYAAVSVHGSSSAVADMRRDFEYLNSFDTIVIAFDNDDPGRKAARDCANLPFPVGKVKVLTLTKKKDANDYLKDNLRREFMDEWWKAPVRKPDGIKFAKDMYDEIINRKDKFAVTYPWTGLQKKTYGMRDSELIIVTADTKVGKTTILKELEHHLLTNEDVKEKNYGVGFLHIEEPNGDTALGLLSIHNSVPYHLPDSDRPVDDIKRAFSELLDNDRAILWDHFGSNSVDAVLDKIRHMYALGCHYFVLDHLSIVVSDQSGDERKQLDEIATKLKTLTMELDIVVIAVIHTNRQGQIRGTAGVEQLANIVIRLKRDKEEADDWRRNITKVSVTENRFCGDTGPASYLFYNPETGRLTELTEEEERVYEQGGTIGDDAQAF